jgi:hypothetical protein
MRGSTVCIDDIQAHSRDEREVGDPQITRGYQKKVLEFQVPLPNQLPRSSRKVIGCPKKCIASADGNHSCIVI